MGLEFLVIGNVLFILGFLRRAYGDAILWFALGLLSTLIYFGVISLTF